MSRYFFITLFVALISPGHAERFTLESGVTYALRHNPDLAAARLSIEEARGRLAQAGRWSNPELESELKPNLRGREFSIGVGFVQRFPLTNRLRLEKAVSQAQLAAAEAEIVAAERTLATSVRSRAVQWLVLQDRKALKARQILNSKELAATAATIASRAEGSTLEAAQLELEARQLALEVLQLEGEQAVLEGEVRPLLGLRAGAVEFYGALPAPSIPGDATPALATRPDYQAAQARLEASRRSVEVAQAGRWEDIGVGLGAELERSEDAPEGLATDGFIGLRFSLPLPLWNKNEGRIQEASAAAARAEREAEALGRSVRAEAVAALGEMKAARRILDETNGDLLPMARALEEKLATYYKQAQPGTQLSDVLRSREKRLALEQAHLDALRTYHLARVRFDAAMGR